MRLLQSLSALVLLSAGVAAHADTFQYNLNFSLFDFSANAVFTSPSLITSDALVTATGSSSSGAVTSVAVFGPGDCGYSGNSQACFSIQEADFQFENLFFATLPASTGTFQDEFGDGNVTITDIAPSAATPEPSTFVLLASGLVGGAGAFRRRFA
jgi:hypothetical protein